MKDFLKKWKSWSLPSKLTAIGTFFGIFSVIYMLALDGIQIMNPSATWEEYNKEMELLVKDKKYSNIVEKVNEISSYENNYDIKLYYSAIVTMRYETDLGGLKAERLLSEIKPESKLYIKAQKKRVFNGMKNNKWKEIYYTILDDMIKNKVKNYYYYFLLSLPVKEFKNKENLRKVQKEFKELTSFYQKIGGGITDTTSVINAEMQPSKSVNMSYVIYKPLIFYTTYMKLSRAAYYVCDRINGIKYYKKAEAILTNNKKLLKITCKDIGFKFSLIEVIQKVNINAQNFCENKNITNCREEK